jgi:hypothetical protein
MYAGYMLTGGLSWRLYFYVEIAFAGLLLLLAFVFVEETAYKRGAGSRPSTPSSVADETEKEHAPVSHVEYSPGIPARRSFAATLKLWGPVDHDVEFFWTAIRSFTYFLVPVCLPHVNRSEWPTATDRIDVVDHLGRDHVRHLHRPRRSRVQLHLPRVDHGPSLQLEPRKLG